MSQIGTDQPQASSGRVLVAALLALAVAFVGYLALGMPGMDHSSEDASGMDHPMDAPMSLSPAQFGARVEGGGRLVLNVHVPDDGSIPGTDAAIPYDTIVGDDRLPSDLTAPILLYCRSGRMSEIAGRALLEAGFTDVSHLKGGMDAWRRSGRSLVR